MLAPIPFDAPVTTATFPSSFFDMSFAPQPGFATPCPFRCAGRDKGCDHGSREVCPIGSGGRVYVCPPQPWIEQVAQTVPEKVVRLDPLGGGFHLVGIEMIDGGCNSGAAEVPALEVLRSEASSRQCVREDTVANGCKTSIAHPTSSRSPIQPGIDVRACSTRPSASCRARRTCAGSPLTSGECGTSGSTRPSGRRNLSSPSRCRST